MHIPRERLNGVTVTSQHEYRYPDYPYRVNLFDVKPSLTFQTLMQNWDDNHQNIFMSCHQRAAHDPCIPLAFMMSNYMFNVFEDI